MHLEHSGPVLGNTLCYGDNLDILREFDAPPTKITTAQAERVKGQGNQGKFL